jgi:hypothetical protein
MKGVACDGISLVEGSLIGTADAGISSLKLNDVSMWKSIFGEEQRKVMVYGCVS